MMDIQRFTRITGEIDSSYHEAAFRLGQSNSVLRRLEQDDMLYLKSSAGKNKAVFFTKKGYETAQLSVGKLQNIEEEFVESLPPFSLGNEM